MKKSVFSLNSKTLEKIIKETSPSCQNESINEINIGFGFIYYSLVRNFKPKTVVAFGSTKGFSPTCFGLGVKDNNNNGVVHFVDAGYSDNSDGLNQGMGGIGFWNQPESKKIFKKFKLEKIVKTYVMKTSDFLKLFSKTNTPEIDLLFIDANHSYEGFKFDFDNFSKFLSSNGIILFHDVLVDEGHDNRDFGVKKYFEEIVKKDNTLEYFRFPIWPGLCIIRKTTPLETIQCDETLKQEIIRYNAKLNKIYTSKTWKILALYKRIIRTLNKLVPPRNGIFNHLHEDDWEKFKFLRLHALKNEPQAFGDSYQEKFSQPDEFWKERIFEVNQNNNYMTFAFQKNKIIGTAGATQTPEDKINKSATLCKVYVLPEARGKNISVKLIKKLIKRLKRNHIKTVHLFVTSSQKAAIHIYQKIGFSIKRKTSMKLGDGKTHNGLYMEKTI